MAGKRPPRCHEHEVDSQTRTVGRPDDVRAGVPASCHRQPHQAGEDQTGGGTGLDVGHRVRRSASRIPATTATRNADQASACLSADPLRAGLGARPVRPVRSPAGTERRSRDWGGEQGRRGSRAESMIVERDPVDRSAPPPPPRPLAPTSKASRFLHARPDPNPWVGYKTHVKAIQFSRFGGPEVLELVELPDPHPGARADPSRRSAPRASTRLDWKMPEQRDAGRRFYRSRRPAARSRASSMSWATVSRDVVIGDRVFGFAAGGGGAGELALSADYAPIPPSLDFAGAAGLPVAPVETAVRDAGPARRRRRGSDRARQRRRRRGRQRGGADRT